MENSIYRGRMICTYDLKDENGIYYEDLVLEWKEAAANRLLRCVECGAPVYLAAGTVREPYFAHYDIEECDYGSGQESEELRKGKRLLYQLLGRSFPDYNIQARYRLENGLYSTLFCSDGDQSLAIDYRLVNSSLEQFRLRDDYYRSHRIKVIYVLGKRQEKASKQLDWYQNLIQNSMGYLIYLDSGKEQLTLKRSFGYRLGKERQFKTCIKTYPINELTLQDTGELICDFNSMCEVVEHQIEEEKISYQQTQNRLRQLKEEKERREQEELLRMEAYRRRQESLLDERDLDPMQREPSSDTFEELYQRSLVMRSDEDIQALGLNVALYHKCYAMIDQGDGHLVAKKYFDLITGLG
jgi:competence protein CoiA